MARLAIALALVLVAACVPRLAPEGPGARPPALAPESLITADGLALPMRQWLPKAGAPSAVILALHGFNDYSNAFERAGRVWAQRGIATYAYDQRGFGEAPYHGLWPGRAALVGDVRTATRLLRERHRDAPVYLLGDSMGGAVAITALTSRDPPPVDGLILVAPAVWGRDTMPVLYRASLWLAARMVPGLKVSGGGLGIQASDNIEMLRALGRDPLVIKKTRIDAIEGLVDLMDRALAAAPALDVPLLLLYGENDEIIPEEPILRFLDRLPPQARERQRRALYEDGWHMLLRDLQAEVVLEDVARWVADPDAPLPSGAERRALARLRTDKPS